jgi:hypothetical protein
VPFLQTEFNEDDARLSPDGRWLAYWSMESGRGQIYVRPFPGPGGKWQISTDGGDYPSWRRDGRELYYLNESSTPMAVDVNGTGESFEADRPRPLFPTTSLSPVLINGWPYDVTADGQRFIMVTGNTVQASTINVVLNWDAELHNK